MLDNFNIRLLESKKEKDEVKLFIESNHYSHKMPQAIKYRFGMYINDELFGVSIFSIPSNQFAVTSIFENETQHICIELSRVFTLDSTPKNFESYCISKMFKYIKYNTKYDVVLSYADPNFKHVGYLYQALNGMYLGETAQEVRYIMPTGELITRRGLGRSNGDSEKEHVKRILDMGATKIKMKGKHKYLFFTCDKRRKGDLIKKMKCKQYSYPKLNNLAFPTSTEMEHPATQS